MQLPVQSRTLMLTLSLVSPMPLMSVDVVPAMLRRRRSAVRSCPCATPICIFHKKACCKPEIKFGVP